MTVKLSDFGSMTGEYYVPVLEPPDTETWRITNITPSTNYAPGFDENGDIVSLPTSAGAALNYYNTSGSLVWSITPTAINASSNSWCGMFYDKDEALIYLLTVNASTVTDTYYLATINKAGSITIIGSDQIPTDFTYYPRFPESSSYAGTIQPDYDNTSHINLRSMQLSDTYQAVIDRTNGQFISGPSQWNNSSQGIAVLYETPDGIFVGGSGGNVTYGYYYQYIGTQYKTVGILSSYGNSNFPINPYYCTPIIWGDYILLVHESSTTPAGNNLYLKTDFDLWAKELAARLKLI